MHSAYIESLTQPNTGARPSCEPKENLMLKLYNSEFQMTIPGRLCEFRERVTATEEQFLALSN